MNLSIHKDKTNNFIIYFFWFYFNYGHKHHKYALCVLDKSNYHKLSLSYLRVMILTPEMMKATIL